MKRIGLYILGAFVMLAKFGSTLADDSFRVTAIAVEGNDVRVTWQCVCSNTYRLQSSANVTGTWNNVGSSISLTSPTLITTNLVEFGGATNSPARFYHIKRTIPS
jgi:hypothetical protein